MKKGAVAWLIGLILVLPFIGVFTSSIRPYEEVVDGWWNVEPLTFTAQGFSKAWNHDFFPMSRAILNSLTVTVPEVVIAILIATLAAYAFARFNFPIKNAFFLLIVATMAVPLQMYLLPLLRLTSKIGIYDNLFGLAIVHVALGLPWMILFLRSFLETFPEELEDSARIDGASEFTIFRRIAIPFAKPALISVAALDFVWVWNDYLLALILLPSPEKWVGTQAVTAIKGYYFIDWNLVSAAAIIHITIPLLVFIFLNKYYLKGVIAAYH